MAVEYRSIPNYPGYRAGDDGSIWTQWRTCRSGRFLISKWRRMKPSINKRRTRGRTYLYLNLCKDGRPKTFRVHRLILLTFEGPCPKGHESCHWDGNPLNNNRQNLRWGLPIDNRQDNERLDRYQKGSAHSQSKLTERKVLRIFYLSARGVLQRNIAKYFNVSLPTISMILRRKIWTHVKLPKQS